MTSSETKMRTTSKNGYSLDQNLSVDPGQTEDVYFSSRMVLNGDSLSSLWPSLFVLRVLPKCERRLAYMSMFVDITFTLF